MEFKITAIEVDVQSIHPALLITAEINYYSLLEAPLLISGKLNAHDGKTIAFINEIRTNSDDAIELTMASLADKQTIQAKGVKGLYVVNLYSELSPKAIEYIESWRERDSEKAVRFNFNMIIKALEIEPGVNNKPMRLGVNIFRCNSYFVIKQSDWIRTFSASLGIGSFILLELEVPNKHTVSTDWTDLYDRLLLRLNEMQDATRNGDWQKVMDRSRQFFETLKIGDGKAAHKKFEADLKQLFINDRHSAEGFQNLLDSIWKFFDYNSKFIHDKDTQGKLKPIPIATKEDAYMAYAFGVGLLNVIGRKIRKE